MSPHVAGKDPYTRAHLILIRYSLHRPRGACPSHMKKTGPEARAAARGAEQVGSGAGLTPTSNASTHSPSQGSPPAHQAQASISTATHTLHPELLRRGSGSTSSHLSDSAPGSNVKAEP